MPELNLDGIVGPTHNYAGLSLGNIASDLNRGAVSRPKRAALEGLQKARAIADLGIAQGFLPPHERPHLPTLRGLGYSGTDVQVLERVAREDPVLLACVSSASAMWTANAATVTPSADTADERLHFTPANLRNMFHRSLEPPTTTRILRALFADEKHFAVHDALPPSGPFSDEGAANHTRLTRQTSGGEHPGVHLFVYGASSDPSAIRPTRFPARQDLDASRAIARRHGLPSDHAFFAQQRPEIIDGGVFHNDVIAVGNGSLLLLHEDALVEQPALIDRLRHALDDALVVAEVRRTELTVEEAVATYLFNSQLLSVADGSALLVAPRECAEHARARAVIDRLVDDPVIPISRAVFMDVRESMRNGGGPACLRLRVPITERELKRMNQSVLSTPARHAQLCAWIERNYPETLTPAELADPELLRRSRDALDELSRLLSLGSIYDFQRE